MDATPACQVTVTLVDLDPPVWRRLVLPGQWTLNRVHDALQVAMGWCDAHLHEFATATATYGVADEEADLDELPEDAVFLAEVLLEPGDVLRYRYDFGDGWVHDVVLEALVEPTDRANCLGGARACPPEDSGGPRAYADLLAVLADPGHPERSESVGWLGGSFDPDLFDVAECDAAVVRLG